MKIKLELTFEEAVEAYRELAAKCNTSASAKIRKVLSDEMMRARIRKD